MKRPPKAKMLLQTITAAVANGLILYSKHANQRMLERGIIKPEVELILTKGHHEAKKDQFNEEFQSWDYAIKGKTVDGRTLRIVIGLAEPNILVITAIELST
jgi:hypothetical protein